MFNIEIVEKLAKIEGDDLVSIYLDVDRSRNSKVSIKNKVKSLLKRIEVGEGDDIDNKIEDFLEKISENTKSVALFCSKEHWFTYVFPQRLDDEIFVDSFFNLEPLLLLLSENRNAGVLLFNSEEARLITVFLGVAKEHRHLEDRVIRKHDKGGWSQGRFSRKIDGEIKHHLKNSVEYLVKMNKIYHFDYVFLRSDSELENELKSMLPADLKEKIKGDFKIDYNSSVDKVVGMVDKLLSEEVEKEVEQEMEDIEDELNSHRKNKRLAVGLREVASALYENNIVKIIVSDGYSSPGLYCHFCGYIATVEEYCPYDQTPNNRTKNIVSYLIDRAIGKGLEVEVLKNNEVLKNMGEMVAILRR